MVGLTARDHLLWNERLPEQLRIVQQDGPGIDGKATPHYMVVADYGWAERILCTGSYIQDAFGIAYSIGEVVGAPVYVPGQPVPA